MDYDFMTDYMSREGALSLIYHIIETIIIALSI